MPCNYAAMRTVLRSSRALRFHSGSLRGWERFSSSGDSALADAAWVIQQKKKSTGEERYSRCEKRHRTYERQGLFNALSVCTHLLKRCRVLCTQAHKELEDAQLHRLVPKRVEANGDNSISMRIYTLCTLLTYDYISTYI